MAEKIGEAILELKTDVKKLVKGMDKARQSADKSMKTMQTRADKFAKFMKSAAGLGGLVVAFEGVARALKKVFDTAQYAAQVRQTRMAFRSIAEDAGAMADDIIRSMRKMSGETISELDMMLSANRASLLGIPVDKFDDLMAIARASATATGESVGKMFDDIVKGIGRGSPMILDNLGIILKVEEANQKWAEAQGVSTAAMTKQQQSAALMNEVLFKGIDIIRKVGEAGQTLTDVERWQQTAAAAADFRAELGMNLLQAMGQIFESSTQISRVWAKTLKTTRLVNVAMAEGALQGNISELAERWKAVDDQIKHLTQTQKDGVPTAGRTRKQTDAEIEALKEKQIELAKVLVAARSDLAAKQRTKKALEDGTAAIEESNIKTTESSEILKKHSTDLDEWFSKQTEIVAGLQTMTDVQMGLDGVMGGFVDQLKAGTEVIKGEVEAQESLVIALEDHMSAAEALSIAAAEGYLIEKEAAEAALEAAAKLLDQKKEQVAFITGPFVNAYSDAFGKFGEILVEGGNAWNAFREAFKESIAGLLDATGKKLVIMALEALIPLPFLWNPAGAALAAAGAAASFTAADAVRALSEGGDFIVPPGYENDSYPMRVESGERVTVTPAAQAAQGGGQMVHVTFNLGSRTLYDDFSRATANGDLIVHPRSIKK